MQLPTELQQLIADRYVSVQKHPTADLFIYNYTPKAQYERVWNEWTLSCRGLILDAAGQVVARPFPKFFNLDEHDPADIPPTPFDVYEKMDGSLGILYWLDNQPYIATRGSFTSEQAQRATGLLYARYAHTFVRLDRAKTYLFEIIYPENRIVVNYGEREDLILLAVIDTATGADDELSMAVGLGFPVVRRYDGITDYRTLVHQADANAEGFVIKFRTEAQPPSLRQPSLRIKLKLAEYVRLHRILTGVSNILIWEYLAAGQSLDKLLETVPDEFYTWVKQTKAQLEAEFVRIDTECRTCFQDHGDRRTNAIYYQTQRYPSVLFKMLDNKPYDHIIWKHIRPRFQKAFKENE